MAVAADEAVTSTRAATEAAIRVAAEGEVATRAAIRAVAAAEVAIRVAAIMMGAAAAGTTRTLRRVAVAAGAATGAAEVRRFGALPATTACSLPVAAAALLPVFCCFALVHVVHVHSGSHPAAFSAACRGGPRPGARAV